MQAILGFLLVFGSVFSGYLAAAGKPSALWQPAEMVIIFGAALGSLVISNPPYVLKNMLGRMKLLANKGYSQDYYKSLLAVMFELLEIIRKEGMKKLDDHIENPESSEVFNRYPEIANSSILVSFIADNLRMMALGKVSHHDLESALMLELDTLEQDLIRPSKSLAKIADAMPGFGIIAAVLGIVITMQNIGGSMTEIGISVAAALVGTFLGILMGYGVLEPISNAMASQVKKEMMALNMTASILVAQAQGKPTILALDAGRRVLHSEYKPSFAEMESWMVKEQP